MRTGWDDLEDSGQEVNEDDRAAFMEYASLYRDAFSTDTGKRVLELLVNATINKPTLDANTTQFGAGIREGQNNIVRQILANIKIAEEGL